MTVNVDDPTVGRSPDASTIFNFTLLNVSENQAPSAVTFVNAVLSVGENSATPRKVADIVISDDVLGTNELTLSGADAAGFEIVGTELHVRAGVAFDYETKTRYFVTVNVDDATVGGAPDASALFTLDVTDVNEAATAVVLANTILSTEETDSALTAALRVTDIAVTDDALGTNDLSLTGTDAAIFELVGTRLFIKAGTVLDFEDQSSYSVTVEVNDPAVGGRPDASTNFAFALHNVNDRPVVTLANVVTQLTESTLSPNDRKMADIVVTDDALGSFALSLSGADAGLFKIVGTELFLKAGTTFDFETKNSYSVRVDVDDPTIAGSPDNSATLDLSILDIYEPPEIEVSVDLTDVADGGTVSFGAVAINSAVFLTFTVRNTGSGALILQPLTISGTDFTLTTDNFVVGRSLRVGDVVSFTVRMSTGTAGTKSGSLLFSNNDNNEHPFNIELTGAVINAAPAGVTLIDDGDVGFELTGSWLNVDGYGLGTDAKAATGNDGSKRATWTFGGLVAGQYRVEATWLPGSDRADNAPYMIRDGIAGAVVGTVNVNQKNAPTGAASQSGRPFAALRTVTITGDMLVVELSNTGTNGAIIADAVRLVMVTPPPNTPEIDVLDGAASLNDGAVYDFGQVTQGATVSKTFTVKNVGTANLRLRPISFPVSAFTLTSANFQDGQELAPNATATITVAMNTSTLGTFGGGLSFDNNDADEGSFDLTFRGKVNAPGATTVTLDDGEAGFVLAGSWNNVPGY